MPVLPIAHDQALTGAFFFRTSSDGLVCGVPIPRVRLMEGRTSPERSALRGAGVWLVQKIGLGRA